MRTGRGCPVREDVAIAHAQGIGRAGGSVRLSAVSVASRARPRPEQIARRPRRMRPPPPCSAVLGGVVEHVAALAEGGEIAGAVAARVVGKVAAGEDHKGDGQHRHRPEPIEARLARLEDVRRRNVPELGGRASRASDHGPRPATSCCPGARPAAHAADRNARSILQRGRSGPAATAWASRTDRVSRSRVRNHNHHMTAAAMAMAERKRSPHLS